MDVNVCIMCFQICLLQYALLPFYLEYPALFKTYREIASAIIVFFFRIWYRVTRDELLWKDLFYRHYKIDRLIPMAPGQSSWLNEYKRLHFHTPAIESETIRQHTDQVLHVSFSHNGKMFATSSKDGYIKVIYIHVHVQCICLKICGFLWYTYFFVPHCKLTEHLSYYLLQFVVDTT